MTSGIPDMAYIRHRVAITDVAHALDLRFGADGKIHCWHPERHKNGDATASVSLNKTTNRAKCFGFGCDTPPLSPVDLVGDVLGLAPKAAAMWIAERFEVPSIEPRKHLVEPERIIHMAGFETPLGLLIRSGLWAELSGFTQRLAIVLLEFSGAPDPTDRSRKLCLSYRAMQRYVGTGSPRAISEALGKLVEIGWIEREKRPTPAATGPRSDVASYILTPFSDAVQQLANATAADLKAGIEIERELRKERKRKLVDATVRPTSGNRKRATTMVASKQPEEETAAAAAPSLIPGNTVYHSGSAFRKRATTTVARKRTATIVVAPKRKSPSKSKKYPRLKELMSQYLGGSGAKKVIPSDRQVADTMDAAGGASEDEVAAFLVYLRDVRGLPRETEYGLECFNWFRITVWNDFRDRRARQELVNPHSQGAAEATA